MNTLKFLNSLMTLSVFMVAGYATASNAGSPIHGEAVRAPAAIRAELPNAGQTVVRDIKDGLGNLFRITVTAPVNQAVDPRLFDAFKIVAVQHDEELLGSSQISERAGGTSPAPVDVSGYTINVDLVTASTCTAKYYWYSNYSLTAGSYIKVTSTSPEFVGVSAYPESGDVNAYVYVGTSLCSSSKKSAGNLDYASCVRSDCINSSSTWYGYIKNETSSTAVFEGIVQLVYIN